MVGFDISSLCSMCEYRYTTLCNAWRTWVEVGIVGMYGFAMSVRGKVVLQFMIYVLPENIYFKQLYNTITIS